LSVIPRLGSFYPDQQARGSAALGHNRKSFRFTRCVAECRRQCDTIGIEIALGRMFAQSTNNELAFLDLNWPLVLWRQFIIHAVHLGAAALSKERHCSLELIQ